MTGYAPDGPLDGPPKGPRCDPAIRSEAFTAALAGVDLGAYDRIVIEYLCLFHDGIGRTLVSIINRARRAPVT